MLLRFVRVLFLSLSSYVQYVYIYILHNTRYMTHSTPDIVHYTDTDTDTHAHMHIRPNLQPYPRLPPLSLPLLDRTIGDSSEQLVRPVGPSQASGALPGSTCSKIPGPKDLNLGYLGLLC